MKLNVYPIVGRKGGLSKKMRNRKLCSWVEKGYLEKQTRPVANILANKGVGSKFPSQSQMRESTMVSTVKVILPLN
jgi:hypothetical protein